MRASNDFLVVGMAGVGTAVVPDAAADRQPADRRRQPPPQGRAGCRGFVAIDTLAGRRDAAGPPFPVFSVLGLSPHDRLPILTGWIRPTYPPQALNSKLEGFVEVTFTLNADGSVAE
jgi:hypothetical protein